MPRITKKLQNNFTQTNNLIINFEDLDYKALGIYVYLMSKPDDWDFSLERLAKAKKKGIDYVRTGVKELERLGLLVRTLARENGNFDGYNYDIYDSIDSSRGKPIIGKTVVGKTDDGKTDDGKSNDISNNIYSKKEYTNKEEEKEQNEPPLRSVLNTEESPAGPTLTKKEKETPKKNLTTKDFVKELTESVLPEYIQVTGRKLRTIAGLETNYAYWRGYYEKDEVLKAIGLIPRHDFWSDKMTLTILLRRFDRQKQGVNYIQDLLDLEEQKPKANKDFNDMFSEKDGWMKLTPEIWDTPVVESIRQQNERAAREKAEREAKEVELQKQTELVYAD